MGKNINTDNAGKIASPRSDAKVIGFILSRKSIVELARTNVYLYKKVIDFIKQDVPIYLVSDPALYRKLREAVTEYRLSGWGK